MIPRFLRLATALPLVACAPAIDDLAFGEGQGTTDDTASFEAEDLTGEWDAAPPETVGTEVAFTTSCGLMNGQWTMTWALDDNENRHWTMVDEKTEQAVPADWLPAECLPSPPDRHSMTWELNGEITFSGIHYLDPAEPANQWSGIADLSMFQLSDDCLALLDEHDATPPVVTFARTK